jgi:hypothetical protein
MLDYIVCGWAPEYPGVVLFASAEFGEVSVFSVPLPPDVPTGDILVKDNRALRVTEQIKGTYNFPDAFVKVVNGVCYATKKMAPFIFFVPRKVNDLVDPVALVSLFKVYFPDVPNTLVGLLETASEHCASIVHRHLDKQRKIIHDQVVKLQDDEKASGITVQVSRAGHGTKTMTRQVASSIKANRMVDYCSMTNVVDMWFSALRMYHILGYTISDEHVDCVRLWLGRILWEHEPIGECSTMLKALKKDFEITLHLRNFKFGKKDGTSHQHLGRVVYRMSKSADAAVTGMREAMDDQTDNITEQLKKQSEMLLRMIKPTIELEERRCEVQNLQRELEQAKQEVQRLTRKRTFDDAQEQEHKDVLLKNLELQAELRREKGSQSQKVQKLQDAWRVHIQEKYVRRSPPPPSYTKTC